jgi:hypothetical protein
MDKNKQQPIEGDTRLHLTDNSTLQTREEKESDNKVDASRDEDISVSEDDLRDAKAGRLTGRDDEQE